MHEAKVIIYLNVMQDPERSRRGGSGNRAESRFTEQIFNLTYGLQRHCAGGILRLHYRMQRWFILHGTNK